MLLDLEHLLRRLTDSFNSESRFYWPLVVALFVAMAANVLWYYWRPRLEQFSPAEDTLRPWVFWVNLIFLIWALVLLIEQVPFYSFLVSFAINGAILLYLYAFWLPPKDAAWERELRRLKYIPEAERRARRRR